MKFFNHRIPWQVLVLIALLLAGWGGSNSSKRAGNSSSPHASAPSPSTIPEFVVPTLGSHLQDMVVGPDGNLWFTEFCGNKIGRITPSK
jgi:streptogramin lyase